MTELNREDGVTHNVRSGRSFGNGSRMIYHAVPNLTYGSIGLTTAAGNDVRTGRVFSVGAPIVGPFEDGFDASTTYLQTLGCSDADLSAVTVAPGIDVHTGPTRLDL